MVKLKTENNNSIIKFLTNTKVMRKSQILLGAVAALSMGLYSCSNEGAPEIGGGNAPQEGNQYMAVRIQTAGLNGTRAGVVGNPEFEDAKGTEGDISPDKLFFYFFDANGNPFPLAYVNVNGEVITNVVKPTDISQDKGDDGETTIEGVLVLGKAVGEGYVGTTPSKVVCVANPTVGLADFANKSLGEVLGALSNVPSQIPAATGFLMTSSTYANGTNVITAVDVTGNFENTPAAAEANPATIYIERVAAKVRAQGLNTFAPKMRDAHGDIVEGEYKVDNADANLTVELVGWQLRNTANRSYAFKKITDDQGALQNWFDGWNNADLHRSYWAVACGITPQETVYDIYDEDQFTLKGYNANNPTENIAYCYESTGYTPTSVTDRTSQATAIIVKGIVKKDGQPIDMMRWAGAYYTSERLKQRIAENYSSHTGTQVTTDDVTFVADGNNKWHAQVNNTDWSTDFNNIQWWKDGVTSYYLNIEHLGGKYGVVRNHIYDYTFEDVVGFGVPGNDPTNPEDEEETFLAARLYVLNWHVVSNKVILE